MSSWDPIALYMSWTSIYHSQRKCSVVTILLVCSPQIPELTGVCTKSMYIKTQKWWYALKTPQRTCHVFNTARIFPSIKGTVRVFLSVVIEPPYPYAAALMRRDTEFLRLRKCGAKRKASLTAMLSAVNFLYTTYTWTVIDFFRWLNLAFSLDPVHCSTKQSVWAGAALYFSKLRLCWSVITVGNRSTKICTLYDPTSKNMNYKFCFKASNQTIA